ncbi:MAG: PIN domain-containing protein [Limnochordia bacterium]
MVPRIFVDTNVLVYAYDREWPAKQQISARLLDDLITSQQAVCSAQVLAEFFVVVTQKIPEPLSLEQALTTIDRLRQCVEVVPVTAAVVREAARAVVTYRMSFWDAQVWAVAHLNQIELILSEDLPGSASIEGVNYRNPFPQ